MIFKVLRYQDCQAILQGAKEARKTGSTQDDGKTLRFFASYSAFTLQRQRAFSDMQKELYALGIPLFLIYPATLRVTHKGKKLTFTSAQDAENFRKQITNSATRSSKRQPNYTE
ncbi:hypothetical protein AAFF_G00354170 [Aldrovandia affinis]|uniref:Uncharacterized protein n=1 Tax=Aldrovandia affinis TaxID=143900 RepID=A0AAD7WNH8_9TELE|nr:hypothetical protein AAFF_G00354170 [Aldrovandia affinis]